MKYMKNKKNVIFMSIAAATLIAVVLGATYAYFVAQGGGSSNANVDVQSNTTDNLSFSVGDAINITANESDFGAGANNKSGLTTATATLTANNATNSATRNYYVYLDITENDFEYTVDSNTAELLLKVTNPDGSEVTSIPGLVRKTSGSDANEVTGFDITTSKSFIEIADNYEITATSIPVEQEWIIEIIFVNLESDQNGNTNKTFSANLIIQEEKILTLANYIMTDIYTADGVNGLYLHDGVGSYINSNQEAKDNSYRYSGGDYQVTEMATEAGLTRVYTADVAENNGVINFYCNGVERFVGYVCDSSQEHYYTTAYNEIAHYDTLQEVLIQAVSDGYLTSDNIKNFICFGSNEETCSNDNLYRIIGVFDGQVKVIKADYANSNLLGIDGDYSAKTYYEMHGTSYYYSGNLNQEEIYTYYWNSGGTNNWRDSNLNNNFLLNIGEEWSNIIAEHLWQVGGGTFLNLIYSNANTSYENEVGEFAANDFFDAKVGLMYISDYYYSAMPTFWGYPGLTSNKFPDDNGNYGKEYDYRSAINDNWLYLGLLEWTISRTSNYSDYSMFIDFTGYPFDYIINVSSSMAVRPSFYLNSDVEIYEGHAGTQSDPYRIVI